MKARFSSMKYAVLKLHPAALVGFVIIPLAAILSLLYLGGKSIWLDEAISIEVARSEWPTMWHIISQYEPNMGLYYIILHLWTNFGESELAIRSLSAIFAVLTVPTIFALGSRLFNKWVGLLAALILTVNPFFIRYAQEARGYSLVLLLVSLSSLFFVVAMQRPSKWAWAAYIITSVFAVYAQVFAIFVLVAHAISLLFLRRQDKHWKGLIIAGTAIVLLILPLGFSILTTSAHNLDWVQRPGLGAIYHLFVDLTGSIPLLVVMFLLCLVAVVYVIRQWLIDNTFRETSHFALLVTWMLAPILIAFCVSQIKPIFVSRYFIICIPPLALLAGIGISRINRRWILAISLVVLLVLSGFQLHHWYIVHEKEDYRGATTYVLSMAEEGDAIVFYTPNVNTGFKYYQSRIFTSDEYPIVVPYFNPDKYQSLIPVFNLPVGYAIGGRLPEPDNALPDRLGEYDHIWLVLSHDQISHLGRDAQSQSIRSSLEGRYGLPDEREFNAINVLLFSNEDQSEYGVK